MAILNLRSNNLKENRNFCPETEKLEQTIAKYFREVTKLINSLEDIEQKISDFLETYFQNISDQKSQSESNSTNQNNYYILREDQPSLDTGNDLSHYITNISDNIQNIISGSFANENNIIQLPNMNDAEINLNLDSVIKLEEYLSYGIIEEKQSSIIEKLILIQKEFNELLKELKATKFLKKPDIYNDIKSRANWLKMCSEEIFSKIKLDFQNCINNQIEA